MKKICSLIIVAFSLSLNIANASDNNINLAKKWTDNRGRELLKTFSIKEKELKYKKLDEVFSNYVDVAFVGKFSLGKYYRQLNADQKTIYLDLFKRYCLSSYKKLPLSFAKDIAFEIVSAKKENKSYVVKTNINLPKELQQKEDEDNVVVSFYLRKSGNSFLIHDIKVMEVSLLLSFRNKFTKMMFNSDGEIDWFLEDFEVLIDRIEDSL